MIDSELFIVDALIVSLLIRLNTDDDEKVDLVEEFLYKNCFDIESDLMITWISSTMDSNELRTHDGVIRAYIKTISKGQSEASTFYADIAGNSMGEGYKYRIMEDNEFLLEREMVTQLKTVWSRQYSSPFKGAITLHEDLEEVGIFYAVNGLLNNL